MPRSHATLPRLYVDTPLGAGAEVALGHDQVTYLVSVLRRGAGDKVVLFNGRDGAWLCEIAEATRKIARLMPVECIAEQTPPSDLWYGFAPLKTARLDYVVQKATEMGAGIIQPVITRRTQVNRIKYDRMRANALEAAEQCEVLTLPEIREDTGLDTLIADWTEKEGDRVLVFANETAPSDSPIDVLKPLAGRRVGLLIGPEGGFDEEERALLMRQSFVLPVSLGPRILRADTAAVAALAVIQSIIGRLAISPLHSARPALCSPPRPAHSASPSAFQGAYPCPWPQMTACRPPIESKADLIAALSQGEKAKADWRVGTEHEKFVFFRIENTPVPYEGERGIKAILEAIIAEEDWIPISDGPNLIGLKCAKTGAAVSLEPGGQLELSGAPLETIHQTCRETNDHLKILRRIADPMRIAFLGLGVAPTWSVDQMPVMPKSRYAIMKPYMEKKGSLGTSMMFRSSTVQANLDFSDEADMVKKMRVSLALQPIATALFANSPFLDGKPSGFRSFRSEIWRDTDPDRTGMLPFAFEEWHGL